MESDKVGKAVQDAWVKHDVPQCGYCQSGMLMAAAALLAANPQPSDRDIDAAITNICRCGIYPRLRESIRLRPDLPRSDRSRGFFLYGLSDDGGLDDVVTYSYQVDAVDPGGRCAACASIGPKVTRAIACARVS